MKINIKQFFLIFTAATFFNSTSNTNFFKVNLRSGMPILNAFLNALKLESMFQNYVFLKL